ncbi:hypothetical protein LXA43DRAFT_382845 [Ganoderma leucocontextum]|nr:hypothetical protein LXA43DRAFT_382845 [Ganoderma leucocontextum]
MMLSTFWDRNGERQQLESFPESFQHWELGEPLEEIQQALLQTLEGVFGKKVIRTELRAMDKNLVLEVEYDDGHQDILRMPEAASNSNGEIVQDLSLFIGEVALLQWLEVNVTALPIPRVLTVVHHSDGEPYTFAVIEKMPGDCLLNVFGGAPFDIKESIVRNTASFMLELNSLVLPQRIGTTLIRDGVIDLVPLMHVIPGFNSARVFNTLEEYMHSLMQAKRESDRIGSDDVSRARANEVLDRLAEKLPSLLQRLSSSIYRRCILSHDDLNETNVLVNSDGDITGIIDWEYHSARPVVLAAQYPCYLRYDGVYDPRFGLGEKWWVASPEDAARLRAIYDEVVKAQNEDYWRALIDGELLRQVYEWLTDSFVDPGCTAMGRWMDEAFGSHPPVEVKARRWCGALDRRS